MKRQLLPLVALAALLVPALLSAQAGSATTPGITVTRGQAAPPPPPAPPPAPPAGSPQPSTPGVAVPSTSPFAPVNDLYRAGPRTYAPRYDRLLRRSELFGGYGNIGYAGVGYPPDVYADVPRDDRRGELVGYLRVAVQPGTAQIFVDGLYVGTVDDSRAGVTLPQGPHRVEIRATGFETATFDVRITAGEIVTYRRDLEKVAPRPQPTVAVAKPKTFYVIPGCYAGDRQPLQVELPKGCNATDVRTVAPLVSAAGAAVPGRGAVQTVRNPAASLRSLR